MAGVAWKEVEPFVGLVAATVFCGSFHALTRQEDARDASSSSKTRKLGWPKDVLERKRKVLAAVTLGLVLGFAVLCGLLVLVKFPAKLQTTHPKVAEEKRVAREMCEHFMQDMDIVNAEVWIRNHTVSRTLAQDFAAKQRKSIDRALRPIVNQVFFRMGAMCAVLPIILVLGAQVLCHVAKWRTPKWFPSAADTSFVLLPVVQMACAYTWAVAVCFHFWLRERQVTNCMLLSGHWYTALHTIVAAVATALWLRFECNGVDHDKSPGERRWTSSSSPLPLYFLAWIVAYVALTSRTLSTSQQFHHDWQESVEGIKCMIMTLPITALAASFVLYVSTERAQLEFVENGPTDKAHSTAHTETAKPLAPQQSAEVAAEFTSEGEGELSVSLGTIVRRVSLFRSFSSIEFTILFFLPKRDVPFLKDIRNGTNHLKKHVSTTSAQSKQSAEPSGTGLMGALAERLAERREHIDPTEESADSEWN
ncbi:Hypothetical Protein FCC1311_021532 [Hondaea fermentalgiana]|uniref:Transmembrane protein n=1 Tax=Hondaea fermentalgiana TaxID=2315210 RepID=A0A2R5GDR1_9STRA|nr:Hypothetical Protein FCC1311_021532 [Hondaea fermentalgiana]|eukprot:GBG25934.1 Hypothetical Protein FCC1311_021532 [Hondaea fermentalgiana]